MTQNLSLPVVFLHDTVVLPGMVVPIELDDSARAAIDAARLAHDAAQDSEPARVLVALYGVFALAAGARAAVQLSTRFDEAPVAYLLSAFAAVVYEH